MRTSRRYRVSMRTPFLVLFLLAGLAGCGPRQFVQSCRPVVYPGEVLVQTVPPFQQVRRGQVRLRVETEALVDVAWAIDRVDTNDCPAVIVADPDRAERAWAAEADEHPDVAGEFVLHTLTVEDQPAGERITWEALLAPEGQSPTGEAPIPATVGQAASVAFVGSFAPPTQGQLASALAQDPPDLVFLGGDLQDGEVDGATWSRLMHDLAPMTATSLVHTVVGEKDVTQEPSDEASEIYDRWFGGQGRPGARERAYTVDLAGVRFVVLDTTDARLSEGSGGQWQWMTNELDDIALDDTVREGVVVLHQGPYSLGEQRPGLELRASLVPALQEAGVRLVLSAQTHGYERFDIDGIQFVNDGGGGALLADLDAREDEVHGPMRQAASATHGHTRLNIAEDGGLTLTRLALGGGEVDRYTLGPPP